MGPQLKLSYLHLLFNIGDTCMQMEKHLLQFYFVGNFLNNVTMQNENGLKWECAYKSHIWFILCVYIKGPDSSSYQSDKLKRTNVNCYRVVDLTPLTLNFQKDFWFCIDFKFDIFWRHLIMLYLYMTETMCLFLYVLEVTIEIVASHPHI